MNWNTDYRYSPTLFSLLVLFSIIPILLSIADYQSQNILHYDKIPSVPEPSFETIETVKWNIIKQYDNGTNWGFIEICRSSYDVEYLKCTWTGGENRTTIFSQLKDLEIPDKWINDSGFVEMLELQSFTGVMQ